MRSRFMDPERRTPQYQAAVDSLRKLSADDALRAFAEVARETRLQAFKARGLTERGGHVCFDRLVRGRACSEKARASGPSVCEWARYAIGADHLSEWRRGRATESIVYHPYEMCLDDLRATVRLCDENGLYATIGGRGSWHFPGWTVRVELQKANPKRQT